MVIRLNADEIRTNRVVLEKPVNIHLLSDEAIRLQRYKK